MIGDIVRTSEYKSGLPLLSKTKIQGQFKIFANILTRIQGFYTFFKVLWVIKYNNNFCSLDRLLQRYTSMSTLSKMNFIQLYPNARYTHSSTNVYIPVPNVLGLLLSHTVFSFFLASWKHAVATERADKS